MMTRDQEFTRDWLRGDSAREMGLKYKMTPRSVSDKRDRMNLPPRQIGGATAIAFKVTPEILTHIQSLLTRGFSDAMVAKELGVSKSMARSIRCRGNLVIAQRKAATQRRRRGARTSKPTARVVAPVTVTVAPEPRPIEPRVPAILFRPVSPGQCLFPMWAHHSRPNGLFCEAARVRGSYCEKHSARCYAPQTPRAVAA